MTIPSSTSLRPLYTESCLSFPPKTTSVTFENFPKSFFVSSKYSLEHTHMMRSIFSCSSNFLTAVSSTVSFPKLINCFGSIPPNLVPDPADAIIHVIILSYQKSFYPLPFEVQTLRLYLFLFLYGCVPLQQQSLYHHQDILMYRLTIYYLEILLKLFLVVFYVSNHN